jgi:hypothetical protein
MYATGYRMMFAVCLRARTGITDQGDSSNIDLESGRTCFQEAVMASRVSRLE